MDIPKEKTKKQEKMESRARGNVIFQFILQKQLLPHFSDGYQLPRDRETRGSSRGERKTNCRWISRVETGQDSTVKVRGKR